MSQSLALLYGLFTTVAYLTRGNVVSLITAVGVGSSYWGSAYMIKRANPVGYDTAFATSVGCVGWSLYWFRKHGKYQQGAQAAMFFLPTAYYGYLSMLYHRGRMRIAAPPVPEEKKKYF